MAAPPRADAVAWTTSDESGPNPSFTARGSPELPVDGVDGTAPDEEDLRRAREIVDPGETVVGICRPGVANVENLSYAAAAPLALMLVIFALVYFLFVTFTDSQNRFDIYWFLPVATFFFFIGGGIFLWTKVKMQGTMYIITDRKFYWSEDAEALWSSTLRSERLSRLKCCHADEPAKLCGKYYWFPTTQVVLSLRQGSFLEGKGTPTFGQPNRSESLGWRAFTLYTPDPQAAMELFERARDMGTLTQKSSTQRPSNGSQASARAPAMSGQARMAELRAQYADGKISEDEFLRLRAEVLDAM